MKTIDVRDYTTRAHALGNDSVHNAFNAMLEDARMLGGATLHFSQGAWMIG